MAATFVPLLLPPLLLADGARRGGSPLLAASLVLLTGAGWVWGFWQRRRSSERVGSSRAPAWPWRPLAVTGSIVCALALLQGDCLRWSALSYSIPLGVRFYGIGNELMGWWIGVTLLAVMGGVQKRRLPGDAWPLLALAALIGHPGLGANVGGGITAVGAAGVLLWPWLRRRPGVTVAALCASVLLLVVVAAWDASRPLGEQTHLGRLALRVMHAGPGPFLSMAAGKVGTNLRISLGLWGVIAAGGAYLVGVAGRRAPRTVSTEAARPLLPAAIIAFLCNDSGVIAAALMLSLAVVAAGPERARDASPSDR
jgi:hypothetical protein